MRARITIVSVFLLAATLAAAAVQSPSEFLGFTVGADKQLADYHQIVRYFNALAQQSPRVQLEQMGQTTLGNPFIMAVISSEQNLKNKARYQEITRKLADPRGLSKTELDALTREGKAIVLITCNIHSSEIGSSQMAMEWAYQLATTNDPALLQRLDNIILLLVPSLNPDGQIMETEWYRKYLGTKWEGGRLPYLYHHYVGHDNNRDWYMLTQKETRQMNRAVLAWHPQVWLDEHQMGSNGPRIFTPPYADPVAKSLNPMIFRAVNMIGTNMQFRLEEAHKSGVIYGFEFDAYWPGGTRNTAWWKNIFGLLTEVASANLASPLDVSPTELTGGRKGLVEYGKTINYPNPWPGGTWRLRDIVDYELIISNALLETVSERRADYLRGVANLAQAAIDQGKPGEAWIIALDRQHDAGAATRLAQLMREHGVEVRWNAERREFMIPTAQPYGGFVAEMFSTQRYPETRLVQGSDPVPPYDVAAWSLPLLMGVTVEKTALPKDVIYRPATDASGTEGKTNAPQAAVFALAPEANDATRFVNAALKAGAKIEVARATFTSDNRSFAPGTFLVSGSGLDKLAADARVTLQGLAQRPQVATATLRAQRVGLFKPFVASADEGWTRWVLEQYGFNVTTLDNAAIRAGKLNEKFDAIILPDANAGVILNGRRTGGANEDAAARESEPFPPEYSGGVGREGVAALRQFVDQGGTLIALADAGEFVAEQFTVPVRNTLARVRPADFSCPGSLVRIQLDPNDPIAYGMPRETGGFLDGAVAWQTSVPGPDVQRSVAAWYPDEAQDVLLSGWIRGADKLVRHAAAATFQTGKGKIVLFGFHPQHRGQSEATYKLLFNAIRWSSF